MSPKGSTALVPPATSVKPPIGTRTPINGKGSPTASTQTEHPKSSSPWELEVSDFTEEPGVGAPTFGGPGAAVGKPSEDFGAPAFGAAGKPAEDLGFGEDSLSGGAKAAGKISPEDTGFGSSAFGGAKAAAGKVAEPANPFVGGESNKKNLNDVVQASSTVVSNLWNPAHHPSRLCLWASVHAT
jgi:hypothetical protein